VGLAFIVGVFQVLHMIISNRVNITLLDLDSLLAPESSQRTFFISGIVESANSFLEKHNFELEKLEAEATVLEERARQDNFNSHIHASLKNNTLAQNLAGFASSYIYDFFTLLYKLTKFGRGEVFDPH
jgi:hypothetical protein